MACTAHTHTVLEWLRERHAALAFGAYYCTGRPHAVNPSGPCAPGRKQWSGAVVAEQVVRRGGGNGTTPLSPQSIRTTGAQRSGWTPSHARTTTIRGGCAEHRNNIVCPPVEFPPRSLRRGGRAKWAKVVFVAPVGARWQGERIFSRAVPPHIPTDRDPEHFFCTRGGHESPCPDAIDVEQKCYPKHHL